MTIPPLLAPRCGRGKVVTKLRPGIFLMILETTDMTWACGLSDIENLSDD